MRAGLWISLTLAILCIAPTYVYADYIHMQVIHRKLLDQVASATGSGSGVSLVSATSRVFISEDFTSSTSDSSVTDKLDGNDAKTNATAIQSVSGSEGLADTSSKSTFDRQTGLESTGQSSGVGDSSSQVTVSTAAENNGPEVPFGGISTVSKSTTLSRSSEENVATNSASGTSSIPFRGDTLTSESSTSGTGDDLSRSITTSTRRGAPEGSSDFATAFLLAEDIAPDGTLPFSQSSGSANSVDGATATGFASGNTAVGTYRGDSGPLPGDIERLGIDANTRADAPGLGPGAPIRKATTDGEIQSKPQSQTATGVLAFGNTASAKVRSSFSGVERVDFDESVGPNPNGAQVEAPEITRERP